MSQESKKAMNALISLIKRHPLVAFFVLAYGFSWGLYTLSAIWPDVPFLFPFGSLIAAVITASVTRGKQGLRELLQRCIRWRVGLRWYIVALIVPVAICLVVVALNIMLGAPMPTVAQLGPWYSVLVLFPIAIIDAPLQEHVGWHGYAMPHFPASRSALANTLILGLLVAGWHLPLALQEGSITVPYFIGAVASTVVTTWVYFNARESALLAILYHTAANTVGLYLFPGFSGADLSRAYWLLALVNCVVVVIVVFITGPSLQHQATPQLQIAQTRQA